MAETLVKEKICGSCGADVRPQATFCYNCGSAVAPDIPLTDGENRSVSDSWFKDDFAETDAQRTRIGNNENDGKITANEKLSNAQLKNSSGEIDTVNDKPEISDLSKIDSAAKIRKRGKPIQKKRVEIVWEEHENAPNGWFIFFALFFTILALAMWFISTRLE